MPRSLILTYRSVNHAAAIDIRITHFSKRERIKLVLASKLKSDGLRTLRVHGGLGTELYRRIDSLVVRGRVDAEVVRCGNRSAIDGRRVANGGSVPRYRSLLHIVASFTANQEALMTDDAIHDGMDVAAGVQVEERAHVKVRLLEEEVELLALVACRRREAV